MRKILIPSAIALAVAGSAVVFAQGAAAPAQPGSKNPALVTAGTYAVEPTHTQILFAYDHMGFTDNIGLITQPTGTLVLDPKKLSAATLSIDIPLVNLHTGIAKLDTHLASADFFDVAKFPTAKFVSTSVKIDGEDAEITGNLTIKGITKPVVIEAEFKGAGTGPMSKKATIGFAGHTMIKRSEFGLAYAVPIVSDAVELKIVAAFEKQ